MDTLSQRQPVWMAAPLVWIVAAGFVLFALYLNFSSLRESTLTDFHIYYEALQRAARGEPVYDIAAPMPFLYPPFYLILLRPMQALDEPAAMTLWLYLQNGLLVLALAALLLTVGRAGAAFPPWAVILFAGFSPIMLNNLYGQTNPLYLALLSLFLLGYVQSEGRAGRRAGAWEVLAAAALSTAVSIRILPLTLVAMAAIQRRWRFVLLTGLLVLAEALAAARLVGARVEWSYFTSYIFQLRGHENMREISLLAFLERLAPAPAARGLFAAAVIAGVGLFLAFGLGPMRRRAPWSGLHGAFVIASMVLFAPLLEYHHYVLLLAPYALVLGWLWRTGRRSLPDALPVFVSWAVVSGANQLSHYRFAAVAFVGLAGAAMIWGYCLWLIAAEMRGQLPHFILFDQPRACPTKVK